MARASIRSEVERMSNSSGGKVLAFIKEWSLPLGIVLGVIIYYLYMWIPLSDGTREVTHQVVSIVQPLLIFMMLFISFCKVNVVDLKPAPWDKWHLIIQCGSFVLLAGLLMILPDPDWKIIVEGAMLAMICPTATAAAVVTDRLGGSQAHIVSYTIMINLAVSILIPILCPLIHPHDSLSFLQSFLLMLGKVFPMLICPLILAILVRLCAPAFHARIVASHSTAFVLWVISLPLAITEAVKNMYDSHITTWQFTGLLIISGIACFIQFFAGKKIGAHYSDEISAGQALGQKNTVFVIWLGYTFFNPVTAAVGGLYSIFHNSFNAWQLHRKKIADQ